MGDEVGYGPGMLNDYMISILQDKIQAITNEDKVQWLEEIQGPSKETSD